MEALKKTLKAISAGNPWRGACNTALPVIAQNNKRRVVRIAGELKKAGLLPAPDYADFKGWTFADKNIPAKAIQIALPGQVMAAATKLLSFIPIL